MALLIVNDNIHKKLKEYANKTNMKMQYITDNAIIEYLEKRKLESEKNGK